MLNCHISINRFEMLLVCRIRLPDVRLYADCASEITLETGKSVMLRNIFFIKDVQLIFIFIYVMANSLWSVIDEKYLQNNVITN